MDNITLGNKLMSWLDQKGIQHSYFSTSGHSAYLYIGGNEQGQWKQRICIFDLPDNATLPDYLSYFPAAFLMSDDFQRSTRVTNEHVPSWAKYLVETSMIRVS